MYRPLKSQGTVLDINELYHAAERGDSDGERQLFHELLIRFRIFALQRVWDDNDAEDVLQEALATISREFRQITIETSFAAWAYRVLDNKIMAYLKTKKRLAGRYEHLNGTEGNQAGVSDSQDPELKRRLLACIKKVGAKNAKYVRALNLHCQGYDTEEICRRLDITSSNFYAIMSRARSLLELCLETGDIKS
jgi:RNA polymerase sigma-70 factor (ECF subfamily)